MTTAAHVTSLRRGQHSADRRLISATSSLKQCVRNNLDLLDLKAPRDWGWLTNPSRAASSRVSNRTTRGCVVLDVGLPPEDQGLLPSLWRQDFILSDSAS